MRGVGNRDRTASTVESNARAAGGQWRSRDVYFVGRGTLRENVEGGTKSTKHCDDRYAKEVRQCKRS